jgi:hypothetical protein
VIASAHTTIDYVAAWATFGTALGTIGLAAATFVLALKTRALAKSGKDTADAAQQELSLLRNQAEAAQRQSVAAEAALNASARPLLIDIPRHTMKTIQVQERPGVKHPEEVDLSVIASHIDESPRAGHMMIPVRNVGPGVALGLAAAAGLVIEQGAIGAQVARGRAQSVIAAGESGALWFEDVAGVASAAAETPLVYLLRSGADFVVEVAYCDVSGRQQAATSLYLTKSGTTDRTYRVTKVDPAHPPRLTREQLQEPLQSRPEDASEGSTNGVAEPSES